MRSSQVPPALLVLVAAAGVLCTGCAGPPSSHEIVCPAADAALAVPAPPQLIYPEPNATNVPDGNFPLVLSQHYPYLSSLSLVSSTAPSVNSLQPAAVPSPLPSPAATPNPVFSASPVAYAVPALAARTAYSVVLTSTGQCAPPPFTLGTFTTR